MNKNSHIQEIGQQMMESPFETAEETYSRDESTETSEGSEQETPLSCTFEFSMQASDLLEVFSSICSSL